VQWRIQGEGATPPIDWMHLKTSESFAKMHYFCVKLKNGKSAQPFPRPYPLPFRHFYSKILHLPLI